MTIGTREIDSPAARLTLGQMLLLGSGGAAFALIRFYQPGVAPCGLILTGASVGSVVGLGPRYRLLQRLSPGLLALFGGVLVGIGAVDAFRGAQMIARAMQIGRVREVLSELLSGLEEIGWGLGMLGSAAKTVLLFSIALCERREWAVDKERQIEDVVSYSFQRRTGDKGRTLGGFWRRLSQVFSERSSSEELYRYLREEYRSIPAYLLDDSDAYAAIQDRRRRQRLESGFALLSEREISDVLGEPAMRGISSIWLVDRLRAHGKLRAVELAIDKRVRELPEGEVDAFLERLEAVEEDLEEGVAIERLQESINSLASDRHLFEASARQVEPLAGVLSQVDGADGVHLEAESPEEVLTGLEQLGERFPEVQEPVAILAEAYRQSRAVRAQLQAGDTPVRLERLTSRSLAEVESAPAEDAEEAFRALYQEVAGAARVTEVLLDALSLEDPMAIESTLFDLGLCRVEDLEEAGIMFTREGTGPEDFEAWEGQDNEQRLETIREGLRRCVEEATPRQAPERRESFRAAYHLAAEGFYYAVCAAIAIHWTASAPRIFGIGLVVGAVPALFLSQQSDAAGLASRTLTQLTVDLAREKFESTAERFGGEDFIGRGQLLFWTCVIPSLALTLLRQLGVGAAGAVVGATLVFSAANWSGAERVEGMSWNEAAHAMLYAIRV